MKASGIASQPMIGLLGNDDAELCLACELFERVFGQAVDLKAWRWKYHDGPRLASFNVVARAPENGDLLGHVGASAFQGRWSGQHVVMVQVADVMVHPAARGVHHASNLYRQLMAELQREIHRTLGDQSTVIYGFPGERPSRLGQRVGLYRSLYFCASHPLATAVTAPRFWQKWLLGHRIQPVPWERMSGYVSAVSRLTQPAYDQPTIDKSAEYLTWRYRANPHHRYQFWVYAQWGRPSAWWVTRLDLPDAIIDAAWPALGRATPRVLSCIANASLNARLGTWVLPNGAKAVGPAEPTPINAVEFAGVHGWHPRKPLPQFHPGDTDVY